MLKKLMLFYLAVGALVAFAAPVAQADELYEEGSGALEPGAQITMTSTDLVTTSALGILQCEQVTYHGELIENGPESLFIEETSSTTQGCNVATSDPTLGDILLGGGVTGIFTSWHFVAGGFCTYTGDIPVSYEANSDVLAITGSNQISGFPNPPCGTISVTGSFTLETSSGEPVYIS